jgi:hypothetical protein
LPLFRLSLVILVLGACSAERNPAPDTATTDSTRAATPAGIIAGTPPGGLENWVQDIRDGTATLPELAATDPAAAQKAALDLYIGRQEYIEMYWGEGGRVSAGGPLGEAVMAAEARFHELMQALPGSGGKTDVNKVRTAVAALAAQYDAVLTAAKASNVSLTPGGAGAK